jgi:alanine-glyoxylate transaminase/serine-glyoxylate transaminase/serine-pyruvate transaminase
MALRAGIEAMGLRFHVAEPYRLPQLNTIVVPDGVDEAKVRTRLLADYDIEIGAGLGTLIGKVWRVGLLGQSASAVHVTLFLAALEKALADMKAPIKVGVAVPAAQAELF